MVDQESLDGSVFLGGCWLYKRSAQDDVIGLILLEFSSSVGLRWLCVVAISA